MRHPSRFFATLALPLLALALFATPRTAHAKAFLITHGDDISHVADVPEQHKEWVREATEVDPAVGLLHQHIGLFWLAVWTWEPNYVLFDGDNYWDLPEEEIADILGVTVDELPVPWTYRFPPGLLALIVIIGLWIFAKTRESDEELELADVAEFEAEPITDEEPERRSA